MKPYFLSFFLCIHFSITFSQEKHQIPKKQIQRGFGKLDFLSINMSTNNLNINEKNMNFTGINYNLLLNDWSYVGIGLYGAVGGIRGGFFTLGINAGIQKFISNHLFIDAGFHFGGGGGANAPDGGGAFIMPHFNLGYQFKKITIASGWSYINFFENGKIESNQLNVAIQIPLSFEYTYFKNRDRTFLIKNLKNTEWNQSSNKLSLLIHLNNLFVKGNSQFTNGNSLLDKIIRLAGFELNSYFTPNWFFFLKADGAYHGIPAGYMDVFFGAGYHLSINKNNTNILAKFGMGAGGGGGVDTEGGFLLYPNISLEQRVFNTIYLSINKGCMMSPNSHFLASTFGVGLKYYVNGNGIVSDTEIFSKSKFKGFETIVKQDLYFNADRVSNGVENMYQISLQLNLFLTKYLYVSGQTSFANFGNAGAYAEGIVGFGIESNTLLNDKTTIFSQVLGGAAGGGGISTGQGFIVKPSFGINYEVSDVLKLRGAIGYVKAYGGNLSSYFINFGLSYRLSFLTSKK